MENDGLQPSTETVASSLDHEDNNHPISCICDEKPAASADSWGLNGPVETEQGEEMRVRVSDQKGVVVSDGNDCRVDDGGGGFCSDGGGADGWLTDLGGLSGEGASEKSEIGVGNVVVDEKLSQEGTAALTNKVERDAGADGGIVGALERDGSKSDVKSDEGEDKEGELEDKVRIKGDSNEEITSFCGSISRRRRGRGVSTKQLDKEMEVGEACTIDTVGDDNKIGFSVGDFVWGKVKSHPWWPGRIFDSSDASEYALTYKHEGRMLVGYFGDHSFAWCDLDQLKPFVEHFDELSRQSSTKGFLNGLEAALDEFDLLIELEAACSCVSKDEEHSRTLVINAGIKEGTWIHEGGLGKFSISQVQPSEILGYLRHLACSVSESNPLHVTLLKRLLPAFFRTKGSYPSPEYYEASEIGDSDGTDFQVEGTVRGPMDEDSAVGAGGGGDELEIPISNLLKRRKFKSIAEMLGTATDFERKSNEDGTDREERHIGTQALSARKRRKTNGDDQSPGDNISSTQIQRKARRHERSPVAAENKASRRKQDASVQNGSNFPVKRKLRVSAEFKNHLVANETSQPSPSPRERKKSKYLSPPYTSLQQGSSIKDSEARVTESKVHDSMGQKGCSRISETEGLEFSDVDRTELENAASLLTGTSPVLKCSGDAIQGKIPEESATKSDNPKGDSRSEIHEPRKPLASSSKVLSEIREGALDPRSPKGDESLDTIKGFLSSYISSKYQGRNLQAQENSGQVRRKRNARLSKDGFETSDHKTQPSSAEAKLGSSGGNNSCTSAALQLVFPLESSLPSKDRLVQIYSRYGTLNESKTKVLSKTNSAKVFFLRSSDAEEALSNSQKNSPFGDAQITYKLKQIEIKSKGMKADNGQPSEQKPQTKPSTEQSASADNGAASRLTFVKQKLEEISSILAETGGRLSPEMKSNLVNEMKELLNKLKE